MDKLLFFTGEINTAFKIADIKRFSVKGEYLRIVFVSGDAFGFKFETHENAKFAFRSLVSVKDTHLEITSAVQYQQRSPQDC